MERWSRDEEESWERGEREEDEDSWEDAEDGEEEMSSGLARLQLSRRPRPQLDMRHGFLKQIIRNQVDRDQYDKEVKQREAAKTEPPPSSSSQPRQRSGQPLPHLYVPPHRKTQLPPSPPSAPPPPSPPTAPSPPAAKPRRKPRRRKKGGGEEKKGGAGKEAVGEVQTGGDGEQTKELRLEVEDAEGQLHSFSFAKDDDPIRVSKIVAQRLTLSDKQAARLRIRLQTKLQKL